MAESNPVQAVTAEATSKLIDGGIAIVIIAVVVLGLGYLANIVVAAL